MFNHTDTIIIRTIILLFVFISYILNFVPKLEPFHFCLLLLAYVLEQISKISFWLFEYYKKINFSDKASCLSLFFLSVFPLSSQMNFRLVILRSVKYAIRILIRIVLKLWFRIRDNCYITIFPLSFKEHGILFQWH